MSADDVIVVACPSCSQKYRVPESRIGHRATCRKCGQKFRIAFDAPIDEDTLIGWVTEGDPGASSVMGGTAIFGAVAGDPAGPPHPKVPSEPRIRFDRIDEAGAHFDFPASRLRDIGLRSSLPQRCVHCLSTENLNVHLLIWGDKLAPSDALRAEEAENRTIRAFSYLRREHGEEWLIRLPGLHFLPSPFDLPFPYYVCGNCGSPRGVTTGVGRSGSEETCLVGLANLSVAAEFYRNNGARGTAAYSKLLVASRQQRDSQWELLPLSVRFRISQWFSLHEGERFLGYYADRDVSRSETGNDGLILTDRRIVCRKRGSHQEFYLNRGGTLDIRAEKTVASIAVRQGSERTARLSSTPLAASSLAKSLKALNLPWTLRANIGGAER
jgi:hypothetical protein